jgi:hypothetical protein
LVYPGWKAHDGAGAGGRPVTPARGEFDPMNSDEQFGVPVATLPGLRHNALVEGPERV